MKNKHGLNGVVQNGNSFWAELRLAGKRRRLGPFATIPEAARQYDCALVFFANRISHKPSAAKFNAPPQLAQAYPQDCIDRCLALFQQINEKEFLGQWEVINEFILSRKPNVAVSLQQIEQRLVILETAVNHLKTTVSRLEFDNPGRQETVIIRPLGTPNHLETT